MKESPEDGAEYILNSGFTCDSINLLTGNWHAF